MKMNYMNVDQGIGIKDNFMDEIITIDFPANMEGITWKKRKPRIINTVNKTGFDQTNNNDSFENKKVSALNPEIERKELNTEINTKTKVDLFDDFLNVQKFINKKIEESYHLTNSYARKEFIRKMIVLLKVIENHKEKYKDTNQLKLYVRKVNDIIR